MTYAEEHFEEIHFETISHVLSEGVKKARAAKEWSQKDLAKHVNAKISIIHEIENGTAQYNPDIINTIERALGTQLDRGRKKKKNKKKKDAF
jgi:putative transcription factor